MKQSHCKRGHPLTDGNVYYSRGGKSRSCRVCARTRPKASRAHRPLTEREKEYRRQYYKEHRTEVLAYQRARYPKIREQRKVYTRTYKEKHQEKIVSLNRKSWLRRKWAGVDYDGMFVAQQGLCAVCLKPESRAHKHTGQRFHLEIDHSHTDGAVRALLCGKCNKALGLLGDTASTVRAAAEYMERYENR